MTGWRNEVQLSVSLYACKCTGIGLLLILVTGIYGNFCTDRGEFLSFRTGITDGSDRSGLR